MARESPRADGGRVGRFRAAIILVACFVTAACNSTSHHGVAVPSAAPSITPSTSPSTAPSPTTTPSPAPRTLQAALSELFPRDKVTTEPCNDDSLDVAGTHAPIGCVLGLVISPGAGPDGSSGTIGSDQQLWLDRYSSAREAQYQEAVHVRYWRQYAGRTVDTVIPGLPNSHLFVTNNGMNCMAMLRQDRVIVQVGCFTLGPRAVSRTQVHLAVAIARMAQRILPH